MSTKSLGRNFKITADGKIKKVPTYHSASARIAAQKSPKIKVTRAVAKG